MSNDVMLRDVLSRLKKVTPKVNDAGWYQACCPYHEDHNPSFSVGYARFECFTCGTKGSLRELAEHLSVQAHETAPPRGWDHP